MMARNARPRCEGECYESFGNAGHFYRCSNLAKVQRDGKWYCGIHDPEAIRRKQERRDAKIREREEARDLALSEAQARCHRLGMGHPHYSHLGSGAGRYTGGVVLTAEEADRLILLIGCRSPS